MKARELKLRKIIGNHITNNKKEYIVVFLIFIIGIFLGVLFINNINESQKEEVSNYINSFLEKTKSSENIKNMSVLNSSIKQNVLLALCIWFLGTTVIRTTNCFWNCTI